ncbi:hypothetical protein [Acetobacter oryzoeni]|uniref:hypothetical protein n=1 Tax=Acetobacter oryzoeni TaxID=2500548 RepID=UPI003DA9F7FD
MTSKNFLITSKNEYYLEIYEPDDASCVAGFYSSDQPFMAISVGDVINGTSLPDMSKKHHVRVTKIEHIIFTNTTSGVTHKVCVHTTAA